MSDSVLKTESETRQALENIVNEAKVKVEHKLVAKIFLRPGQKVWVYDPETNKLDEVQRQRTQLVNGIKKHEEGMVFMPEQSMVTHLESKATFDAKKFYCVAINRENAAKKIAKQLDAIINKK